MKTEISKIQNHTYTSTWANAVLGCFKFDNKNISYRFHEWYPWHWLDPKEDDSYPEIAVGYIAFRIRNWGMNEAETMTKYFELRYAEFLRTEGSKPGSSQRDLFSEFVALHLEAEEKRITYSNKIFEYLPQSDISAITLFSNRYHSFVAKHLPTEDVPFLKNRGIDLGVKTLIIRKKLEAYRIDSFLKEINLMPEEIWRLLDQHSGRDFMPFAIALFSKIGYLEYFFGTYAKNKTEGIIIFAKIIGAGARRVKGNVNVLYPQSTDDRYQYTSFKYIETITKELEKMGIVK